MWACTTGADPQGSSWLLQRPSCPKVCQPWAQEEVTAWCPQRIWQRHNVKFSQTSPAGWAENTQWKPLKTSAWSSLNFGDGTKATESERPLSMAGTKEKNTSSDITFLCKYMHPLPFSDILLILVPNAFFTAPVPVKASLQMQAMLHIQNTVPRSLSSECPKIMKG